MSFLFEPENILPYDGIAIYHGIVFNEQAANGICKDNDDSVGLSVSDRVEMFKKQREAFESVDSGTPNYEVVTVATTDKQYEGYKWGHAWVTFVAKTKAGQTMKTRAFAAFAIKDGKIHWEQVIYDAK